MTKVLIVDDSALMRRLIGDVLKAEGFTVETARNGREGVERLTQWQPDVVTLDINMPEMDGLTALSLMMQARPTPIIMVSSLTAKGAQATLEALALGAVDFITKPGGTISLSVDDIARDLVAKVRAGARARLRSPRPETRRAPVAETVRPARSASLGSHLQNASGATAASATRQHSLPGLIVVGVSTGGPRTLEEILPPLPSDFSLPVVIAQHMPANFTSAFAERMDRLCQVRVQEVSSVLPLEPGHVYIGKGGTDVVVAERLGRLVVSPRPETAGHPWHPSVDVLVDSALKVLDPRKIIGVQLTGMGYDGAAAMTRLKARGGRTIAESADTAVVFGMPQELIQAGGASIVLPCHHIARQLCNWAPVLERA